MYGQTKWLGELMTEYYARQHGLEAVIIRFCGFQAARGYDSEGRIDWPRPTCRPSSCATWGPGSS